MVGYPIPTDGVVGRVLRSQGRHPFRPAHLHALIVKQGFKVLISQVYDPDDPHIATDVQFGVTRALMGEYIRHDEPHPSDAAVSVPWYSLDYTYVWNEAKRFCRNPPLSDRRFASRRHTKRKGNRTHDVRSRTTCCC
jgi:catechol 1,2-dioxygenase